jgi:hypothetical protein
MTAATTAGVAVIAIGVCAGLWYWLRKEDSSSTIGAATSQSPQMPKTPEFQPISMTT